VRDIIPFWKCLIPGIKWTTYWEGKTKYFVMWKQWLHITWGEIKFVANEIMK